MRTWSRLGKGTLRPGMWLAEGGNGEAGQETSQTQKAKQEKLFPEGLELAFCPYGPVT